jgi:hypothetical protein
VPIVSAWIWNQRSQPTAPVRGTTESTTHRLPVEIIVTEAQPQWVLVPIDPG